MLVSTWKEWWYKEPHLKSKQDKLAKYLDKKLKKQGLTIYDKTEDINPKYRGDGILFYLWSLKRKGTNIDKCVIFDDKLYDYKKTGLTKYLIQTGFYNNGLTSKHKDRAIAMLTR